MSTVIALINRKGGVGKTTSACYIAACLAAENKPVLGLDLDPEQSWLNWYAQGVLPYEVKETTLAKLERDITAFDGYVVIDSPPNSRDAIEDIPMLADEVIVPLAPTVLDVNRLLGTVKAVAKAEKLRNKPLGSVLLVRYRQGLNLAKNVTDALEEQGFPLLENKIRQLTRYEEMSAPEYLEEYQAVLKEIEVL